MLRVHKIVRAANELRKERWARAFNPFGYEPLDEIAEAAVSLRAAEGDGLLDPAAFDAFQDLVSGTLVGLVERFAPQAAVADAVAVAVYGGKVYKNRLDRQLNVGASALAHNAVEERIYLGMREALRVLALRHHERAPAANPPGPRQDSDEEGEDASADAPEAGEADEGVQADGGQPGDGQEDGQNSTALGPGVGRAGWGS